MYLQKTTKDGFEINFLRKGQQIDLCLATGNVFIYLLKN